MFCETSQAHHPSLGLACWLHRWITDFSKHIYVKKYQSKCTTDKQHVFLCLIDACNWLAHGSFWHGRLDLPRPKPAQSWRRNCFRASCSVLAFMSMPKVKISPFYCFPSNFTLHESISLCSSWSCTWYFSFSDDMEDTRYLSIPVSWTRDVCHSLCHGQHEMLPSLCHWHDKVGTFIRLVGNPRAIRSGLGRVAILCHVNKFMLYVFIKINAEHRPIERDPH